jgi:hypothetical protein
VGQSILSRELFQVSSERHLQQQGTISEINIVLEEESNFMWKHFHFGNNPWTIECSNGIDDVTKVS